MPPRCRRHDPRRAITLGHNPALLRQGPPAPRSCRDHLQPRDGRHRRMLSHTPMSRTLSPLSQGGPPRTNTVQDDTILDFSPHRTLKGAGRVGDDRGTGFLAHSCLAVLPSGATLGLAHQTIWARPPKGVTPQTRESAVWAETVETIGRPPDGTTFVAVGDRGADIFAHLES